MVTEHHTAARVNGQPLSARYTTGAPGEDSSSPAALKTSVTSVSSDTSVPRTSVPQVTRHTSVPPATLEPRQRLFAFVREMRASHPKADPKTLYEPVADWHRSEGRTSDFESTTWLEFLEAWCSVTCPAGVDAVETAMRWVDAGDLPDEARTYPTGLARLIGLCWHLCGPSGRFFLSSRDAGLAMLPCGERTEAAREANASAGWRAMGYLERCGIVKCIHRGTRGRSGKAARYRFIGEQHE